MARSRVHPDPVRLGVDAFVHDEVLPLLFAGSRPLAVPPDVLAREAQRIRRRLSSLVQPQPAAPVPLVELVRRIRAVISGSDPRAAVTVAGHFGTEECVTASVAIALVGAARQAIRNSVMHAGPCTRIAEIVRQRGEVIVVIVDDGVGFDEAAFVPGSGMHISIVQRLSATGARGTVRSGPGRGTRVELRAPFFKSEPAPGDEPPSERDRLAGLDGFVEVSSPDQLDKIRREIAQVSALVEPVLSLLESPETTSPRQRAVECVALAGALRDRLRARRLAAPPLSDAARRARLRGVDVMLLDDGPEDLDPDLLEQARSWLAKQLDRAPSGRFSGRLLPAGRRAWASAATSHGYAALTARPATGSGAFAGLAPEDQAPDQQHDQSPADGKEPGL